ncbi:MAG: type II toxin-antitoxin system VapC family toxin [Magnetospirillum sp. WYHS-4]
MIGLDTNVLVRYLVQDDLVQAAAATRLVETRCTKEAPGFVNRIVLCELVWVLESAYRYPKDSIAAVLDRLLRTAELVIEDAESAWLALQAYRGLGVDFPDALIGLANRDRGCEGTATFDGRATRLAVFFSPS